MQYWCRLGCEEVMDWKSHINNVGNVRNGSYDCDILMSVYVNRKKKNEIKIKNKR